MNRPKAAIYARVSTVDRDQNPETQLIALRDYCQGQEWSVAGEFVDRAPAGDHAKRSAWTELLNAGARGRFNLLLVFRLDRAFRSVLDAATTLERLRSWKVGFRSYCEPWLDTTSPFGEAMYHMTAAYAQLERGVLAERVRAGMERAKREGKHIGRPRIIDRVMRREGFGRVVEALHAGGISKAKAAKELGISRASLNRILEVQAGSRT